MTSENSIAHSPYALEFKRAGLEDVFVGCAGTFDSVGVALAVAFGELGLGVKEIDLAGAAFLIQLDHGPGMGREMTGPREEVVV